MKNLAASLLAGVVLLVVASPAAADIVYSFESPQFTLGQTTPLPPTAPPGVTPNSGDPSFPNFSAAFTSTPGGNAFQVVTHLTGAAPDTSAFSGQYLGDTSLASQGNSLTIMFYNGNALQPVKSVSFDLASFSPGDTVFVNGTSVGTTSTGSDPVGPGAFITYDTSNNGGNPFSAITIRVATGDNQPDTLSIDTLHITPQGSGGGGGAGVPEPATLAVFGVLAAGAFGLRRRARASPAV